MSSKLTMNINEASKLCGLSPSVLRIWELRYGWPNPKRKPNGYRAYTSHQVQELKRMGELVKAGVPISSLIVEALPRWPATHAHTAGPVRLPITRGFSSSLRGSAVAFHSELVDALETGRGRLVEQVLQGSIWSLHPRDEVQAVLAPAVCGLAELDRLERPLATAATIAELVRERGLQLLRQMRPGPDAAWVVPVDEDGQALAVVVSLLLNQRGQAARYWYGSEAPDEGPVVLAAYHDGFADVAPGLADRVIGRVSALGGADAPGLADLLGQHLPWAVLG